METFPNYTHYYTDGAKNEDSHGSAVVQENSTRRQVQLPLLCSVLTTELTAFLAVQTIVVDNSKHSLILTDSLSSLQSFQNCQNRNKIHPLAKQIVEEVTNWHGNIFIWITGHAAITGNELADTARRQKKPLFTRTAFLNPKTSLHKIWVV